MALTIECNTDEACSIEECVEFALDNVDPHAFDSILAVAPVLKKLSNNKNAVAAGLCAYLKVFAHTEHGGLSYSPSSFLLSDAHPNIIFRANIWRPLCKEKERQSFEAKLFAYHHAHNHNFHFLTVGHFGPGYDTDIYEYDRNALAGHIGEPVVLRHVERTRLSDGKIMAYRADRDIHTQFPPESVSVSLNLVVASDDDRNRDQYFFDTDKALLSGYSDTLPTKRVSLLQMAAHLANENIVDVLAHIALAHPCSRTRLQAFRSLAIASPGELAHWQALSRKDTAEMVRSFASGTLSVSNRQEHFDPAFLQLV